MAYARFFALLATVIIGKVIGTVLCGLILGYHVPETASLGLLLTAKGHFHVYLAALAIRVPRTFFVHFQIFFEDKIFYLFGFHENADKQSEKYDRCNDDLRHSPHSGLLSIRGHGHY